MLRRWLLASIVTVGVAHADSTSVLVADDDPELLHALESSLAPWRLSVISDPSADDDPARIADRAKAVDARFVVWREGDQLVVFDRENGATERRPARGGRLDAPDAAAAALTVKTIMRLPPPPPEPPPARVEADYDPAVVDGPPPRGWRPAGSTYRAHASAQARTTGGRTEPTAQLGFAYRPNNRRGWRVGGSGEISTASEIKAAGFDGTWREAGLFAMVSCARGFARENRWAEPSIELEPWFAWGFVYGTLEGRDGMVERTDSAWMLAARVGMTGWLLAGPVRVGATASFEARQDTPEFTKQTSGMGMPTVFEASRFALGIGVVVAIELGP